MRKVLLLLFLMSIITSQAQEVKDTTIIDNGSSSMNTITLSSSEVDEDGEIEDISSLLQGSKDVFINTAGYTFGAARFKIRGYESENTEVFLSGIPMNDIEGGRVYYGIWGGLNDVMRNKQFVNGINKSEFTFGGVGGATNISTRAFKPPQIP